MKAFDDTELSAFVDGELSADQEAEILVRMEGDEALSRRVCALGLLKAQVRVAYSTTPTAAPFDLREGWNRPAAIAAGLLLALVSFVGGWLFNAGLEQHEGDARFVLLDHDGLGQGPAMAGDDSTRIVFHLTNPDQQVAGDMLDEVEQMLGSYAADGRPIRVEIVSHGEGLGLLRQRLSDHRGRIRAMATQYDNLTFVACQNTIDRLRVEKGIEVQLLPDARRIESGVNHVVKRQKQGWAYIRV